MSLNTECTLCARHFLSTFHLPFHLSNNPMRGVLSSSHRAAGEGQLGCVPKGARIGSPVATLRRSAGGLSPLNRLQKGSQATRAPREGSGFFRQGLVRLAPRTAGKGGSSTAAE